MTAYGTIENVELVTAGIDWPLMSPGPTSLTLEDLADMVAAQEDPHILPPRVKLGHIDGRFNGGPDHDPFNQDGAPALGRAVNLRLENDGAVVVGDLVEVPMWLVDSAPSAYPSRSCEWVWNVTTPGDRQYRAVLTAVSLLGVFMPAIADLEDLERFLEEGPAQLAAARAAAAREGAPMPAPAASVDVATVRQRFNFDWAMSEPVDGLDTYWWWARSVRVDPDEIIADDDEGGLWSIPFSTDGEDGVTFGTPVRVRETFVPVAEPAAAAADVERRYGQRVLAAACERPTKPTRTAAATAASTTQEDHMDTATLERLGLAEGATDEEIEAAFARARGEDTDHDAGDGEPDDAPVTGDQPAVAAAGTGSAGPGTTTVSQAALEQLQAQAAEGARARQTQLEQRRDTAIATGLQTGRFPAADAAGWRAYPERHPEGFEAGVAAMERQITELAPGLIPVGEIGGAPTTDANEDEVQDAIRASFGLPSRKEA